ncbi:MAG: hypothetical protein OEL66_08080, partial [Desulfobulbaceae bacterium]|nr:hypothetical protein [Desulfobulbaceae bacterium]
MQREINPPDEIVRRLCFVLYIFALVFLFVSSLLGLVQQRYDYLRMAFLGGAVAVVLRSYGKRHLEFDRLAGSFPYGVEEDALHPELCQEVTDILADASRSGVDWPQRQELRQRLLAILEQNPELWQWFG